MIILCLSVILIAGCSDKTVTIPTFDGTKAFTYLEKQVSFGPRMPGSPEAAACRDYYYSFLRENKAVVDSQKFEYFDPYSRSIINMVNVIATYGDFDKEKGLLFMAHYDSRPRTDFASDTALLNQPIDGANDGASGVAVLMELARIFSTNPPPIPVELVFVDGEDWGMAGDYNNYLIGSKAFAKRPIRKRYHYGLVVDMIGEIDQNIYRDSFSEEHTKELQDMIYGKAHELGITTITDSIRPTILDDHISLLNSGLPAITLIDIDYQYWHTEFDTPDKCSPESLENIGRLLLELIYTEELP